MSTEASFVIPGDIRAAKHRVDGRRLVKAKRETPAGGAQEPTENRG